jgi:uncharacterized membrane protein YfcA
MHITDMALLIGAGFAAGAVNAVAGGGSLITFPALLLTGLPPLAANVTNSIAVCPGYLASVVGSRADLIGQHRRAVTLLPAAATGSLLGAVLLLATPARLFDVLVPILVLAATAALAFRPRLQAMVGHPADVPARRRSAVLHALAFAGAIYGGYFGGALGVVLVAVLALVLDERLQRITALKNVLSAAVGVTNALVFALFGPVSWGAVALLAPATVTGGYLGARLVRRLPEPVLRWTVVAFGATVGAALAIRAIS